MKFFALLPLTVAFLPAADVPRTPIVLELFTSEGCSSCPPADAWVNNLDAKQPVPGAELIILSEHVDYWNHDGWKDRYSSSAITDRQSEYARELHISDIYTPQVIVNGTTELHLNNPNQIAQILQKAAAERKIPVRIESLQFVGNSPEVVEGQVGVDQAEGVGGSAVYVGVALSHAESQVGAGENKGRHLEHIAVLETLKKIGTIQNGKPFSQKFDLKLKPGADSANLRVIAFIQSPGPGEILGATLRKSPF